MDKNQKIQELESIQAELQEIQNELSVASGVDDLMEEVKTIRTQLETLLSIDDNDLPSLKEDAAKPTYVKES